MDETDELVAHRARLFAKSKAFEARRAQDLAKMAVIVCGGRNFHDRARILAALTKTHAKRPFERLAHGSPTQR